MTVPLRDYFLIGNLQTAALVSSDASIDWMCSPCLDSPSIFARIIDETRGGTFGIQAEGFISRAAYLPETAIVETIFEGKDASFSVRDFMLPRSTEEVVAHFLIRKITGIKGRASVRLIFAPRPRYARQKIMLRKKDERLLQARIGERSLWVHIPRGARMRRIKNGTSAEIVVDVIEGASLSVILEHSTESRLRFQDRDFEMETMAYWREWISKGKFPKARRDLLVRSAITLKLLQFFPSGGIVAAPTTSLPETLGGGRNWDYRYVWIRDASFVLSAFSLLGYTEEALKFFRFIEEVAEGVRECEGEACDIQMSVMYSIWGQRVPREEELRHLRGYAGSHPVRIGNGAADQVQLDIFGSLIDAYYVLWKKGMVVSKKRRDVLLLLIRKIQQLWKSQESGIWEIRGGTFDFTYGKVMCWVGMDRAVKMAAALGVSDEQIQQWEALRKEIHEWIWGNCFDDVRCTFRQHPGTASQDATNFFFVLLGFLNPKDSRTAKIIEETRKELTINDVFVYRYRTADGLQGEEGAFLLCSFWMIAALAKIGRKDEARALLQKIHG
ncbi:glycoside hydrolase family 15 protein, partial [Candidatus Peregrinibacteria bacterium]|nr:glycoside hydrolase family 15 protein [Candidatus Peregrinibacteria bacterium]